jgi:hypothetical protein
VWLGAAGLVALTAAGSASDPARAADAGPAPVAQVSKERKGQDRKALTCHESDTGKLPRLQCMTTVQASHDDFHTCTELPQICSGPLIMCGTSKGYKLYPLYPLWYLMQ